MTIPMNNKAQPALKWVTINEPTRGNVYSLGLELTWLGIYIARNAVAFKKQPTSKDLREAKDALEGWAEKTVRHWEAVERAKGN